MNALTLPSSAPDIGAESRTQEYTPEEYRRAVDSVVDDLVIRNLLDQWMEVMSIPSAEGKDRIAIEELIMQWAVFAVLQKPDQPVRMADLDDVHSYFMHHMDTLRGRLKESVDMFNAGGS